MIALIQPMNPTIPLKTKTTTATTSRASTSLLVVVAVTHGMQLVSWQEEAGGDDTSEDTTSVGAVALPIPYKIPPKMAIPIEMRLSNKMVFLGTTTLLAAYDKRAASVLT